jgi:hypothetical protein
MRATAVSPAAVVVLTCSSVEPTLRVPAYTVLPGLRRTGADSPAGKRRSRGAGGAAHPRDPAGFQAGALAACANL